MNLRADFRLLLPVMVLAMAALACNLPVGVPRATPTLAPTHTPSHTPSVTVTLTPTATPSATATASATATPTATDTPTNTPSGTPTPSATPTFTATPTLTSTATLTPTMTSTPTATATVTSSATVTPSDTPTASPVPTDTPTATATPSSTPTATGTSTPTATLTLTRTPTSTLTPTYTLSPTASATPTATWTPRPAAVLPTATQAQPPVTATFTPRPTQPVTPTATELALTVQSFPLPTKPGLVIPTTEDLGILPTSTPVPPTATLVPTVTPLPIPNSISGGGIPPVTSVAVVPNVPPATVEPLNPAIIPFDAFLIDPNTLQIQRPAQISPSTLFIDLAPGGQIAAVVAQDAVYPGYGLALAAGGMVLSGSPLPSNTIRFLRVRWSPNGTQVAFVAETPGARGGGPIGDPVSDGLWIWRNPGQDWQDTHHLLQNRYAYHWGQDAARMVRDFAWSPDNALLLVRLDRSEPYSDVLGLITPAWNAGDDPIIVPHEYGSWSWDSARILVSGEMTDNGPILGWVNRDTRELTVLVDGRALSTPLWMQDAVELADGRIAFFGAPADPADPNAGRSSPDVGLYIYSGGEPWRVATIGGGPIREVEWSARRTAALVRMTSGRTFVVQTGGYVLEVTGTVGSGFVGWAE